jgi:hypothetical protein
MESLVTALNGLLASFIGFLTDFWDYLVESIKLPFYWLADSAVTVIHMVLYLALDGLLTGVSGAILVLDVSNLGINMAAEAAGLPPQLIYLIHQTSIPTGMVMVASALTIRVALNIIPAAFTRL